MKSYKYFLARKLNCKCGCEGDMDDNFMSQMVLIREILNTPLRVTSAYRCPEYNDKLYVDRGYGKGEHLDGPHTTGRAIDIRASGELAFHLMDVAFECGMKGFGVYQRGKHKGRYIHLDNLTSSARPWIWSY
ncbi:MAG: D-Ala-D-Ala carboxypeptidase family metallohydrolase [Candidatus Scalindua sp.]